MELNLFLEMFKQRKHMLGKEMDISQAQEALAPAGLPLHRGRV